MPHFANTEQIHSIRFFTTDLDRNGLEVLRLVKEKSYITANAKKVKASQIVDVWAKIGLG